MTRTSIRSRPFHLRPESVVSTSSTDGKQSSTDGKQSSTDDQARSPQ